MHLPASSCANYSLIVQKIQKDASHYNKENALA